MIKKAFLKYLSKNSSAPREPVSFDRANSVGIISRHEDEAQLDELVSSLMDLGKKPRKVSFVGQPVKNREYPSHAFNSKDISMTGSILSDELNYFTKQKYDFLICTDTTGSDYIKYLLAKTHAQHRIGFFHSNFAKQLDMMIIPDANTSPIAQLMKYMKMIRHD